MYRLERSEQTKQVDPPQSTILGSAALQSWWVAWWFGIFFLCPPEVRSAVQTKWGQVWNKFSAIAAQLNWNLHSSHLYFFPVLWDSLKGSGEGWACKFWKDVLLLPRNNTYQSRPNKCDPHCHQPSVKPADLSHLCVFFLSAKSFNIMQNSSFPLHQSIFSWQRRNCNLPARDAHVLWAAEGFPGGSPKMETSCGGIKYKDYNCCNSSQVGQSHEFSFFHSGVNLSFELGGIIYFFSCLFSLIGKIIICSTGWGGRKEGNALNFPLVLGVLILGLCPCAWLECKFGLRCKSQSLRNEGHFRLKEEMEVCGQKGSQSRTEHSGESFTWDSKEVEKKLVQCRDRSSTEYLGMVPWLNVGWYTKKTRPLQAALESLLSFSHGAYISLHYTWTPWS